METFIPWKKPAISGKEGANVNVQHSTSTLKGKKNRTSYPTTSTTPQSSPLSVTKPLSRGSEGGNGTVGLGKTGGRVQGVLSSTVNDRKTSTAGDPSKKRFYTEVIN